MIRAAFRRDDVQLWCERAVVAALIGYFIAVGCAGIDFGRHWDEWYQQDGMKECVASLSWFPRRQVYNGVYFLIGLPFLLVKAAPFLPGIVSDLLKNTTSPVDLAGVPSIQNAQGAVLSYLSSWDYVFGVRRAFVCLTSLSILWVYLTVRTLAPRPRVAALAAAAFVALSWEVGYHARFIAVDGVVMQFVALQLYAFCRSWRAADPDSAGRWAALTAAAAAAAWASKTPLMLALLPVAALVFRPGLTGRQRRWLAAMVVAAYGATAFVLSPWAFIDPLRYLGDMAFASHAYNDAGTGDAQYVPGWWQRVATAGLWLLAAVPSPIAPCALLLSLVALLGLSSRVARDPRIAIWTGFLALYVALMSLNKTLIVRNYLLAVPFVAAMFGLGVARLREAPWPRWQRNGARAAIAIAAAAFCINAGWGVRAAASIQNMTADRAFEEFRHDVETAHDRFRLSPALAEKLGGNWTARMGCQAAPPDHASLTSRLYLFHREHAWNRWTNNRLGTVDAFYGPLEANLDWYIQFPGRMPGERIFGLSADRARATYLDSSRYVECGPAPAR